MERFVKVLLFSLTGLVVFFLLSATHLPYQAKALAGLLVSTVLFWLFEIAPLGVVALLSASAAVVLGIAPAKEVFKHFAHPLIFLFLGSFLLAEAFSKYEIDRYIAVRVLKNPFVRKNDWVFTAAVLFIPWFLSMWLSNTATTAMLLPIVAGLLAVLYPGGEWAENRLKYLMLGIAYAASVGGITTPVGTPPNLIALGFLDKIGVHVGFGEWIAKALPISLITFAVLVVVVKLAVGKIDVGRLNPESLKLNPLTPTQKVVLAIFSAVVFLWLLPSLLGIFKDDPTLGEIYRFVKGHFHYAAVAVIGAALLFLIPRPEKNTPSGETILSPEDIRKIDWDTILLFGGGLSLGSLMFKTGLINHFGQALAHILPHSPLAVLAILVSVAIFLTEFSSNTATANVLIPLVIALSKDMGLDPFKAVFATTLACSYAFMLPMATPPNAIVFGFTKMHVYEMARIGIILNLIGIAVITFGVFFLL